MAAICARPLRLASRGMAIIAKNPMITTTVISSMSVNPARFMAAADRKPRAQTTAAGQLANLRRGRHDLGRSVPRNQGYPGGVMRASHMPSKHTAFPTNRRAIDMTLSAVDATPAAKSGTFLLGGDLPVHRLGFGAMRLTGQDAWGEPQDPREAMAVLRRAVELGVNLIDTADSYGPAVSERIIAEALHPYPSGLVIANKAGFERPGPDQWKMNGRPAHLRAALEGSLQRLKLERIDLRSEERRVGKEC